MNITLTNNEGRQIDKAMAMVGHAPDGAKRYYARLAHDMSVLGIAEVPMDMIISCPWVSVNSHQYSIIIEDTHPDLARVHAAEVIAAYLED